MLCTKMRMFSHCTCATFALLFISNKPHGEQAEFEVKGTSTNHFVEKESRNERKKENK